MLSVEHLTKRYGEQQLFEEVSFQINPQERIGLVGRNGHGKTTVLRLMVGEVEPDEGVIQYPRTYRIHMVRQTLDFNRETILAEVMQALPPSESHQAWKAEKILAGLGFSPQDMQRQPADFSGGFQVRLNLAKAIVAEPDLLLLDEPTNYLDIAAIRWIKRFLANWPRELVLITHDRSFMDAVVTHTMGIHRKRIRKMKGDTEAYYTQLAKEEEIYEKTRLKNERRRRDVEQFISRFRAKARLANLVQSRIKTLSKLDLKRKLEPIQSLDFSFPSCPFLSKYVLSAEHLTFGYHPARPIIEGFHLSVQARDRIVLVGQNGRGKTTLLRLLSGSLTPQDGRIAYNPNAIVGVFEQTHTARLVPHRTVEEEVQDANPSADRQAVRNVCGAMMFSGQAALKKIGVLSGGEKSRVMLAKLLIMTTNVLLLDEPTNHLDMESCDALLAAIDSYDGTVIMVTHNEMFLHALARRLVVFQNNGVDIFEGSYQRFLESGGWEGEAVMSDDGKREPRLSDAPSRQDTKKEMRRKRSRLVAERSQALKPIEEDIHACENAIDRLEKQLSALNDEMQTATGEGNGNRISELSIAIHDIQAHIDQHFNELEAAADAKEALLEKYEKRLAQLQGTNQNR